MIWMLMEILSAKTEEIFYVLNGSLLLKMSVMGLLGLILGSYAAVVSFRLPLQIKQDAYSNGLYVVMSDNSINQSFNLEDISTQQTKQVAQDILHKRRSHCPTCHALIPFYHNIPVLSYLLLKGRCAYCHQSISLQYLYIEIQTALLFLCLAWSPIFDYSTLGMLVITCIVVILFWTDKTHYLLPDVLTLGLLWFGLFLNLFGIFTSLEDAVTGAMLGYGSLWAINALFKLLRGKEGMGQGDMKYFAAIGACIGMRYLFLVLMLAAGLAILHVIIQAIWRIRSRLSFGQLPHEQASSLNEGQKSPQMIAFGMYLSISFWTILYATQFS